MELRAVSLDDKYSQSEGPIYLTGSLAELGAWAHARVTP